MARTSRGSGSHPSSLQDYVASIHLPLVVILVILCVLLTAIGIRLLPGTDKPPAVPDSPIQLNIYQPNLLDKPPSGQPTISIDETLIQKTSSIVQLQLDLFGSFPSRGAVQWQLVTNRSQSQPYSCPDPYDYLGTSHPNPLNSEVLGHLTISGQKLTPSVVANFVGRRVATFPSNNLALAGRSPTEVAAHVTAPLGEINLCWHHDAPLVFYGQYAAAALPTVTVSGFGSQQQIAMNITRSLYFENPVQSTQPVTAEYALQAGSLPTSTDSFGWHWSDNQSGLIELVAVNIATSQHESYLGFISGVTFGVAASAFVAFLQETLEPVRRRRIAAITSGSPMNNRQASAREHASGDYKASADKATRASTARKLVWRAVIVLTLLITAVAAVFLIKRPAGTVVPTFVSSNDVQPQSSVLIVDNCYNPGRIEPTSIILACGDGSALMEGLSWSQWGTRTAMGSGILDQNNCTPNCAEGTFIAYQVNVTLSEPVRAGSGALYFTLVTLRFPGKGPYGGHITALPHCLVFPPAPYTPGCPAE